jgi:comEA protein
MSWLTQTQRVTLTGLAVAALLAIGLLAWRRQTPLVVFEAGVPQPLRHSEWDEALRAARQVNLNTADAATLARLPEIGPALAERIVAYRERHGQFLTREELLRVQGVGPKTFEQLADYVSVE